MKRFYQHPINTVGINLKYLRYIKEALGRPYQIHHNKKRKDIKLGSSMPPNWGSLKNMNVPWTHHIIE